MKNPICKPGIPGKICLFLLLWCFVTTNSTAQTDTIQSRCSIDLEFFHPSGTGLLPIVPGAIPVSSMTPTSKVVCSLSVIDVYYEDIHLGTGKGFDDPTLGATRRNTFCQVLTDVQNTFSFAGIGGAHLRIYVQQSYAPGTSKVATPGITFLAAANLNWDNTTAGITGGYFNEYMATGSDPLVADPDNYHGAIVVNFDQINDAIHGIFPIYWQNDYATPANCKSDLYSSLLHEMGHLMGWFSFLSVAGNTTSVYDPTSMYRVSMPVYGPIIPSSGHAAGIFTKIDATLNSSPGQQPTSLIPALTYPGGVATINPLARDANNNYWINSSGAPNNYPVFAGGLDNAMKGSFFSHLDDALLSYSFRERISPGDRQYFVMGATDMPGVYKRSFTKGEIQTFVNALGLTYIGGVTGLLTNHLPYSTVMGLMPIDEYSYIDNAETGAIDYTITNNIGMTKSVTIAALQASGDLTDLDGAGDLANMEIVPSSLVNIRGCGVGGNNHASLSLSADHKTIVYTPRTDFYGRAQFGFNITDGHEIGSFRVITIDVLRGTNVTCTTGGNMVCNGDFEEGSEIANASNETIQNSYVTDNYQHEGKWQGKCFSDSHPFGYKSHAFSRYNAYGGIISNDSRIPCFGTIITTDHGHKSMTFPETSPEVRHPMPPSGGNRYQKFRGSTSESYYLLKCDLLPCHMYTIEFDIYKPDDNLNVTIYPTVNADITIAFADHVGALNFTAPSHTFPMTMGGPWQHVSNTFYYCGTVPSSILYIGNPSQRNFLMDNLSLTEVAPPAMAISIINGGIAGVGSCYTILTTTVTNKGCEPLTYTWAPATGLSCTTCASVDANPMTTTVYTVTVSDACGIRNASSTITINPILLPITGPTSVCIGATVALSDPTSGGTWSSGSPAIASVDASTGLVSGINSGSAVIYYTLPIGCYETHTVTVSPSAITGPSIVCIGNTMMLSNADAGGTWSSGNPVIATISGVGLVTAVATGTTVIFYTMPSGCIATKTITVSTTLPPITGIATVCVGTTTILSDAISGGTWSSVSPGIATAGLTTGVITGLSTGTVTISYITGACAAAKTVTVIPFPPAITGPATVCVGSTISLTDANPGGGWTSGNPSVATIGAGTGVVTGVATGTVVITYTTTLGCPVTKTITVAPLPPAIIGSSSLCLGSAPTFSDAVSGGSWSSSNPTIANILTPSGLLLAIGTGTAVITYRLPTGCYTTMSVTVSTLSTPITGPTTVCEGSNVSLSNATSGGTWSSGSLAVATITTSTGVVTGVAAGITVITYNTGGCITTKTVTVMPSPAAITGTTSVCEGSTITLSNTTAGGTWTSGNPTVATVTSSTGIVTGVSGGIAYIAYTTGSGCSSYFTVTVNPAPPITGSTTICLGVSGALSSTLIGSWVSSNPLVADVTPSGLSVSLHGLSLGTTTITCTYAGGCYSTFTLTVVPSPEWSEGGTAYACVGSDVTYTNSVPGGTWSSLDPSILVIDPVTGVATGISVGSTYIEYTLPFGCTLIRTVIVNPAVSLITGPSNLCPGSTITLSNPDIGGVWTSISTSIATIGSWTGVVTGVSPGLAVIKYSIGTGCSTTKTITVDPLPTAIVGLGEVCIGDNITLSDGLPGGTWSSASATVSVSSGTGVVTGVSAGVATITYTTVCGFVTKTMTVNPLPADITGMNSLCIGGSTTILSDATSGGIWSSSGAVASVSSVSGVVTAVNIGTEEITYTLGTGCAITTTVTVYGSGVCPCSMGTNPFTTIEGGAIGTPLGSGRYYIPNNTLIADPGSSITFSNTQLIMGAGVQLDVDWSTELVITGSHLFGCNMWQGLVLQNHSSPASSAKISVTGGSLIEDAIIAIYAPNPQKPITGYLLECDNAIFNRNMTGIKIDNYNPLTATYPFRIRNTVFTSRNFSTYTSGASVYPNVWPPTTGVKGLKTAWTPTDPIFDPPFNIDNPNAGGTGIAYSGANCKNTLPADIGIFLTGVGTYSASVTYGAVPIPSHYAEVVIGDDAPFGEGTYQNLFDNLQYGAHLTNSNVTFVNNAFTHMNSYVGYAGTDAGTGIYAQVTDQRNNHNRLRVYSSAGSALKNVFYGFKSGVECYNYFNIVGENCYMMNKNAGTSYRPLGHFGFLAKSAHYDLVNISYNTITNVNNGISFWATNLPWGMATGWPAQFSGACNVNGNTIQAHPSGYGSITIQRVGLGIALQNTMPHYNTSTLYGGWISSAHADFNTVNDADNGIYINNFWRQAASTSQNTIYVRPQSSGLRRRLQYGINHTLSKASVAYENYVTKSTGVTAPLSDSARAFYIANNTGPNIGCNIEESVGRGYEFFLGNPGTAWHDNSMNDNLKGMVLNNSNIGPQRYAGHPMANEWHGTWSSLLPQTYVLGLSPPTASKLYVSPGSTTNPGHNEGQYFFTAYVPGTTINTVTGTYASPCPVAPTGYDNHVAAMMMYEDVAQDHIAYAYLLAPHRWISQYELWKSIQEDSTLIDSSAVLAQFASMATGRSRYAYLTDIERDLAEGDYASATIKLGYDIDSMVNTDYDSVTGVEMTDGLGANHIVQNYQDYYGLYMKYMDSSLTGSDSLAIMALAGLCPHIHGNVVYHARALYSDIYRDLTVFNDDSCMEADTTYIAERRANHSSNPGIVNINKLQQQYMMYPNPNDGNFELKQTLADKEPVLAEVFDVTGRSVGKEKIQFNTPNAKMRVGNVSPGMYMLQLTDSKKRIFKFKFTIQK